MVEVPNQGPRTRMVEPSLRTKTDTLGRCPSEAVCARKRGSESCGVVGCRAAGARGRAPGATEVKRRGARGRALGARGRAVKLGRPVAGARMPGRCCPLPCLRFRVAMTLDEFIRSIERDPPDTLTFSDIAHVRPRPWVLRAGNGKDARIRMLLGSVRYERQPGDGTWPLTRGRSDLDLEASSGEPGAPSRGRQTTGNERPHRAPARSA